MFYHKKLRHKAHREHKEHGERKNKELFAFFFFLSVFSVISVISVPRFFETRAEASPPQPIYQNDFEKLPDGDPPKDMVPLSGSFSIKTIEGNKVLELPGDPVDGYGILFGPDTETTLSVSARIFATASGKRTPEFGLGVADTNGYKLWVMPSTHQIQILKGEDVKAAMPFHWKSGSWTSLRLQVRKVADGKFAIEGKAWQHGKEEPKDWMVAFIETEELPKGRPSAWGSPYASTPILFDDLVVRHAD